MSYIFRMKFAGLCAMFPKADALTALLINTEHSRSRRLSNLPEPHFPRAYFNLGNVTGAGAAPGEVWWNLDFEDLTIEILGAPTPSLSYQQEQYALNAFPSGKTTATNRLDFAWIPNLNGVCPDVGELEGDWLNGKLPTDPESAFVKARVQLKAGLAKVLEMGRFGGDEVLVDFVPKPEDSKWAGRTALPHHAGIEIELPDEAQVKLVGTPFDGGASREVVLVPEPSGREVEVSVKNLCCGYGEYDTSQIPEEDLDFECYYMLYKNFDDLLAKYTRLPIPVPVDYVSVPTVEGAVAGGAPVKCTLARLGS